MPKEITIGVLAFQGAFSKHVEMLSLLKIKSKLVKKPEDLQICDALIMPGGESTTMLRQFAMVDMSVPLVAFAQSKPVFGTCAGMILMAKKIDDSLMTPFSFIDISVARNAYGRQSESFSAKINYKFSLQESGEMEALFIRAPKISHVESKVKILATFQKTPVLVQQGKHLGAAFHPELSRNPVVHQYFLSLVAKSLNQVS